MKFPLAQEVSRHVRDKVCKFYKTTPPAATVTCSEAESSQTTPKALITSDEAAEHEKVGLDLNFTEILSPSTFRIGEEFAMMIGDEQVVEISFTCKVCDFR